MYVFVEKEEKMSVLLVEKISVSGAILLCLIIVYPLNILTLVMLNKLTCYTHF